MFINNILEYIYILTTFTIKIYFSVITGFGPFLLAGSSFIAEWDLNNNLITPKTYSIGSSHSSPVNALRVINDTHLVSGSDDFIELVCQTQVT